MEIFKKEDLLKLIKHLEKIDLTSICLEMGATEETLDKVRVVLHFNDNFIEDSEMHFYSPIIDGNAITENLIKLNLFSEDLEPIETDEDNPYIFEESLVSVELILDFTDEEYFEEQGYYTYGKYYPNEYIEFGDWHPIY